MGKRIKDLSRAETDGYLAVDNAVNGTGKMNTNIIFNNFASKFVPSSEPNPTTTVAGKPYIYNGLLYVAKVSGYQGAWDPSKFELDSVGNLLLKRVLSEEGKSLIDTIFASGVKTAEVPYSYVFADGDGKILFFTKKDGSFDWVKGIPTPLKPVVEKISCIESEENTAYSCIILDGERKLLMGFRKDGSIDSRPLDKRVLSLIKGQMSGYALKSQLDDAVEAETSRAVSAESELQRQIDSIEPTIVEGGSNNPDEFFLTSIDEKITLKSIGSSLYSKGVKYVYGSNPDFSAQNTLYVVFGAIDLDGTTCTVGQNSGLVFVGGNLRNGVIVGQNTFLCYASGIFGDSVTISGTWIAPKVSSGMLLNPGSDNALKTLLPLLSADVYSEFIVESGDYWFNPSANGSSYLTLPSNTKLVVIGNIKIRANGYTHYQIVNATSAAKNIEVCGGGCIIGDADEHDYSTVSGTHEFGYCLSINNGCKGVYIHDLTLTDATGDGIDITASNFKVERVNISHCGRNGISLYHGENGSIENCIISDIYRVAPLFAIDIEPWVEGKRLKNVSFKNIVAESCKGFAALKADNLSYENITLKNCTNLFYFSSTLKVRINNIVAEKESLFANNIIYASSNSSMIELENVSVTDTSGSAVFDLPNVLLKGIFEYNGNQIFPSSVAEGSIAYDLSSHKYKFFNGTSWAEL